MTTLPRTDPHTIRLFAVADRLLAHGIEATVEYPGALAIRLGPTTELWTGLCGWDYGTVNRLNPHTNCWEPDDFEDSATVDLPVDDRETTVDAITAAWAAWVAQHTEGA